mmetsp:Transcript_15974/g.51217  ORF Transcript_15974/g.51217 Transcript_15974/m.51217 type:complete len:409 (+) Transcript_15974:159-1385(+)
MRQDLTCKFQSSASRYVPSAQVGPASPSAQPAASAAVSSARARVASSMCSAAPRCSCPSSIWKRPLCRFTSVPSARLPMPRKAIAPGRWARRYAKSSPPIVGCTSTYDSAPTSASAARCTVACPACVTESSVRRRPFGKPAAPAVRPRLGVDGRREGAGARRARRRHRGGEAILLDGGERGVDVAAAERRRAPQHRLDLLVQKTVPFLGERADGAAKLDAAWDDVVGRPAVHERRRHHTGLRRCEIARDNCLKTLQRCRHAHERVHRRVRHRRVPSVPDELGVVEACRRHDRARARRDHARRQARPDMQREEAADSRRVLKDAGEAHGEPSSAALLGGLKEELDGAMQLAGGEPLLQQLCGAEQHRRVGVVSARVHLTVSAAAERTVDLFVDGERVHVCAQAHARLLA